MRAGGAPTSERREAAGAIRGGSAAHASSSSAARAAAKRSALMTSTRAKDVSSLSGIKDARRPLPLSTKHQWVTQPLDKEICALLCTTKIVQAHEIEGRKTWIKRERVHARTHIFSLTSPSAAAGALAVLGLERALVLGRSAAFALARSLRLCLFLRFTDLLGRGLSEDLFIERTTPQAPTKPNTRKPARLAIL